MNIREAMREDLPHLLALYTHLHHNAIPPIDSRLDALWEGIIADRNHHIFLGEVNGELVTSCVMVVVPNLTQNQRPYALIENVVTHTAHRNNGYASQLLHRAKETALENRCYKIMLMTGSTAESTWRFYEKAGFNRTDKTAFIQWLE